MRLILFSYLGACLMSFGYSQQTTTIDLTWTYTYMKAHAGKQDDLKEIIIQNWFKMDSVAVEQGLIKSYELIENLDESESREWDFIVAVEYFTRETYADIAEAFGQIRSAHQTVKVNGLTFPEAGQVVKSEVVKKVR